MADDTEILELARTPKPGTWGRRGNAGRRYVRTPEGSKKYGLPIGAPITADAIKRASTRGRSYNVPEDDGDFGTQPPAAGRVRKDAKEMVSAIRAAPAPKRVTPSGPKKVAVGQSGYGFPEGSRTFRPHDHQNFAIVRTPDYQLVVVTDKGVAFELEGDLENELNEELDDDASENFDADEPNANELEDVDGDGQTGETSAATGTTAPLPARVEDMPGFLDQKSLDGIMAGMKAAGLDQASMDTAELQLHRNNNRIRSEYEAAQAKVQPNAAGGGKDGGDGKKTAAPAADMPDDGLAPMETASQPVPERQPEPDEPAKDEAPAPEPKAAEPAAPKADSENKPAAKKEPIKELRDLEELTRNRPSGTAEGTIAGTKTRLRRNRVSNSIEYEVEDDDGNVTPAKDSQSALTAAEKASAARAAKAQAKRPARGQIVTMSDGRRALVLETDDDLGVRVHMGDRGEAMVKEDSLTVVRSKADTEAEDLAEEWDTGDYNNIAIQEFLDDDSADDTPAEPKPDATPSPRKAKRTAARKAPRDTSDLTPDQMTDQELDDAIADVGDFIRTTGKTPAATKRLDALSAEQKTRNPDVSTKDKTDAPDATPAKKTDYSKVSTSVWGKDGPRLDRDERAKLGIDAGTGDFANKTVDRKSALDARPGDKFVAKGGRSQQVYEMGEDGQFHNLTLQGNAPLTRDEFADVIDDPNSEVYEFSGNSKNKAARPDLQPGDTATDTWAKDAPDGAAAYSGDGLIQERKDGEWQTPIGKVEDETFAPSDVADDDSVVTRTAKPDDGRPIGATTQINTADDLKKVVSGDGVSLQIGDATLTGRRLDDGSFELDLDGGMKAYAQADDLIKTTGTLWHVPNRDLTAKPSKTDWAPGDPLQSVDDIRAQKIGTVLKYRFLKPLRGKTESRYTVLADGEIQHEAGPIHPDSRISKAVLNGQVSVDTIPADTTPKNVPAPQAPVITDPSKYTDGDKIADYRHLKAMKPGQQVTIVIPSHQNGGQEAKVVLTRTDDDKVMGGFMFLTGKRGRGYNSFGENNASIFQSIADGRLYYGDVTGAEDDESGQPITGAWDTTKNIEAWKGGPLVSEADLQEFIASQVYSPAMQTSYFDMSLLPATNPFRQKLFRDEFAQHAMKEYSEPGNPFRHKPASIRFAAEKLGLKYNDPGSALIPDDLSLADFKKKVTIGSWLRKDRQGVPLGKPAEDNMGPEQIDVTAADLKTAFAAMDAMLERQDNTEDPDVILKRIFARQGSPLQDLNVAVAIASYYGMDRYRKNADGSETKMTTIARQKDKRNNKALLRQMLQEQLEGREPGYYGLPKDESYTNKAGVTFVNRTRLSRPAQNSDNQASTTPPPPPAAPAAPATPNAPVAPTGPMTRDGKLFSSLSDKEVQDYAETLGEEANLRRMANDPYDAEEQADLDAAWAEHQSRQGAVNAAAITSAPDAAPDATPDTASEPLVSAGDFAVIKPGRTVRNTDTGTVYTKEQDGTWSTSGAPGIFVTNDLMERSVQMGGSYELDADETNADAPDADTIPETNAPAAGTPDVGIAALRNDDPGVLYLEDANGNVIKPKTHRTIPADYDRPLVYDHAIAWKDRQDVFELDNSEQQTFIDAANKLSQGYKTYTAADLAGKRMFVNEDGTGLALLDGETIDALEVDLSQTPDVAERAMKNMAAALVSRGARNAVLEDRTWFNGEMSPVGFRAVAFASNPNAQNTIQADVVFTLDPDYIGQPSVRPQRGLPQLQRPQAIAVADQALADYQKRDFHLAIDKGRAGDGNYKGTKLWGKYGASGLLMRHVDKNTGEERFMLVQRAGKNKNAPLYGKWQLPGGGLDSKETDAQGAARETIEEINPPAGVLATLKAVGDNTFKDKSGWHYANLTADIPEQFTPTHLDPGEILDTKWLTRAEIAAMEGNGELHPALSDSIRETLATYGGNAATALPTQKPTNAPSIFGAKLSHGSIKDPNAKKIAGTQAGSNGGQQWDLPTADGTGTERFFVKPAKSVDAGKQEALASDLYRLAGAKAPEVDFDSKDRSVYSKMMDVKSRGPANTRDLVQEDFAADAWLANWDVRLGDNIMFDSSGNPVRLDNGGALEYRATGGRKARFDASVPELDTLRQAGNIGANTFGARVAGRSDPWEAISAQKVVDVSDQDIRDLVTKHGLNQNLADTLIARRNTIAKRYNLTPKPKAAPAKTDAEVADEILAQAFPKTPKTPPPPTGPRQSAEVPGVTATVVPQRTAVAGYTDREKLHDFPEGVAPAVGDPYRVTLSDGTVKEYGAATPKSPDQGKTAELAGKLYAELGIRSVAAEYVPADNQTYTELVAARSKRDAGATGPDLKAGFVADAWLGNRAVAAPGKIKYSPTDGGALRTDNRGALNLRLNGSPKPDFGNDVTELTSLRDPATNSSGAVAYGTRVNDNVDDFEWEGAQKIVNLSDDRIKELVKDSDMPSSLAKTLIERRNYIARYYGLRASGTTNPGQTNPRRFTDVEGADSLLSARRAVGNTKPEYIAGHLPAGTNYIDYLKAQGNVNKAFDALWRSRNPDKPDTISGGKVTAKALLNDRSVTDDSIIDLAMTFDLDPATISAKAASMNSTIRDPRVLHEVIAEQRGFHDTNIPVDPTEIENLKSAGQTHVFRAVNPHSGMSGIASADKYKEDLYWRRGHGAKAHGEGIYVAQSLNVSHGTYADRPDSGIIEMAFDEKTSSITSSNDLKGHSARIQALQRRIQARTDLTATQKDTLTRAFSDAGTAAALMGYDALFGNANGGRGTHDFNILNKSKITFSTQRALTKHEIGGYGVSNADYRRRQIALQPSLKQSNGAQGNPAPATPPAGNFPASPNAPFQPGAVITPMDVQTLKVGSIITVPDPKAPGGMRTLRKTYRGWYDTNTRRKQAWVDTLTPRSRKRFTVVQAF